MGSISFLLNGKSVQTEDDPHRPLLYWLREQGWTGSKEGCAEGECGACAVALVRTDPSGRSRYEPVNSCLLLLGAVHGHEVYTVEGVGQRGALHPVQQAMVDTGGSQCGYCTPGFVVSLFAEYYRPGRDGYDPEALSGNLCRCTGYRPIRDAARTMGTPDAQDAFHRRLEQSAPQLSEATLTSGRRYYRPTDLQGLWRQWRADPEATPVAGGTDVVVDMNLGGHRWPALVALDEIDELGRIEWTDDALEIGAAVPLRTLEESLGGAVPILEQLWPLFSSRLIRGRATLGGNLATASPIGDTPPALLALGADVRIASSQGERVVPLDELFTGYRQTVLGPGEIIRSIRIPRPFPAMQRFYKVSKRVLDDISTVAAAFAVELEGHIVSRARLAFGGVAPTPVRAREAEEALEGRPWNAEAIHAASDKLRRALSPITDHRGSAAYRGAVAARLLEKFWCEVSTAREAAEMRGQP
jgi:xanthine dehydrogenase small subunit